MSLSQLSGHWTVPRRAGLLTREKKKKLFSSLIYVIYLKRNVLTPFFSEEGHLVLIPFIISVSLVKHHCTVLVFIMEASWGLPHHPAPLLSLSPPSALF